ncbi:hypothetical protein V500_03321 [Pseudogymnoascus sp. VKM F-4518 (FW-2643)]|nr:hypothetical protein V500_03321 [Pseudogymnoascus sp. VKM F-4518 (FW-2643)]
MSVVAVAGGTGSIGRAIVEAIIAQGKYEVIVLGRNSNKELEESLGTRVISADYSDVHSLVALFEQNKIHTVVSAMSGLASPESELALIRAANQSKTTKRFIPSVFGVKYRPDQAWFPAAATKVAAMAELEKTSLEWTIICNGFFLDYWGMPKVKSYLSPTVIIIDVAAGKAAIPGLGSTPVVFTYSVDVAKYVAACLGIALNSKVRKDAPTLKGKGAARSTKAKDAATSSKGKGPSNVVVRNADDPRQALLAFAENLVELSKAKTARLKAANEAFHVAIDKVLNAY